MPTIDPNAPPIDWWDDEIEGLRETAAFSSLTALRALQAGRVFSGLLYESTYEQKNMFSSTAGAAGTLGGMGFGFGNARGEVNLLTYNAMQIGFDTLVSKLTQADAQVKFLTDGGNWEVRKKAEQLEKLVKGEFYRLHLYEMKEKIELDMLLHGRGYLKFYIDHDTKMPCIERVHPLDIFFDELEARDNPPQTMYQTRIVAKASLRASFPEFAEEINTATLSGDSTVYSTRGMNPTQMIEILECWHLPSSEKAGDGKHGLFIQNTVLELGEWTRMSFPFATMTWTERRRGPYPIAAAEQIIFLQRNLNRLIQREHECIYTLSAPYILSSESQALNMDQFSSDGVGVRIEYTHDGAPAPQVVVNKVVPDDVRVAIQQLKRDISDILGITGLESMGDKPTGLDSAPALQEYTEQSSLRHVKTLKENERFVLRAAEQLLMTIRDIKNEYGDYKAFGQGRSEVEEIQFSSADLPPNAYMAQMAAANMLPQTPAGRLNAIVQLAGTGVLSPKQMARAFQSPDMHAIMADVTSTEEDIEWSIYEMTKLDGRYLPPDEHQDLTTGIEKVNDAYLSERRRNAPDAVLERLDRWVAEALVKRTQMEQAAMAQAMTMQAAQGTPGMPGATAAGGGPGESPLSQPGVPSAVPEGIMGGSGGA